MPDKIIKEQLQLYHQWHMTSRHASYSSKDVIKTIKSRGHGNENDYLDAKIWLRVKTHKQWVTLSAFRFPMTVVLQRKNRRGWRGVRTEERQGHLALSFLIITPHLVSSDLQLWGWGVGWIKYWQHLTSDYLWGLEARCWGKEIWS